MAAPGRLFVRIALYSQMQTAEGGHPPLTGDHWLGLGPVLFFLGGHDRSSPGVEDQIVYVALQKDGSQTTHSAAEFASKFGWKNDPTKAGLLRLDEAK